MCNICVNMARKNPEVNRVSNCKPHIPKRASPRGFKTISPSSSIKGEDGVITPIGSPSVSRGASPRTSPGLIAGHYAGCKFTEPPSPSALPKPPQHWTQSHVAIYGCSTAAFGHHYPHLDIAQQLKVLLKVQA